MASEKSTWRDDFKHLVLTGERRANEERKAELKPHIEMADHAYKLGLGLVVVIFFVIMTLTYFS